MGYVVAEKWWSEVAGEIFSSSKAQSFSRIAGVVSDGISDRADYSAALESEAVHCLSPSDLPSRFLPDRV